MNKIWFTSDLHHSHKNIVKFTNRGEETTEQEHNDWLLEIWNHHIKSGDTVYHLGDFSFDRSYDNIAAFVRKLNGNKFFLKGNHDDRKVLDRLQREGYISQWWDYKEIKIEEQAVVLFHFPIMSWHKQSHGSWHLHGHCHGNLKDSRGKMQDVGIDASLEWFMDGKDKYQHKFFDWELIKKIMNSKREHIADNHRGNV